MTTTTEPATAVDLARQYADDLRAMADHIEANPDLVGTAAWHFGGTVMAFAHDGVDFAKRVAALGPCTKGSTDYALEATREFGRFSLVAHVPKVSTCERVVVGTRKVERAVYPDDVEPTIELVDEDIVEWRCPPSFLALGGAE